MSSEEFSIIEDKAISSALKKLLMFCSMRSIRIIRGFCWSDSLNSSEILTMGLAPELCNPVSNCDKIVYIVNSTSESKLHEM